MTAPRNRLTDSSHTNDTNGFAGHMLAFALGRELSPSDSPALDRVAEEAAAREYRMKAMIKAIVLSEPFLGKPVKLALRREALKP